MGFVASCVFKNEDMVEVPYFSVFKKQDLEFKCGASQEAIVKVTNIVLSVGTCDHFSYIVNKPIVCF
jgi:hypothetical protein